MRIGLFESNNAFQCTLNVLLECIEPFTLYIVFLYQLIVLLESIDLILAHYAGVICLPIML